MNNLINEIFTRLYASKLLKLKNQKIKRISIARILNSRSKEDIHNIRRENISETDYDKRKQKGYF